jgi:hypothetical protein
LEAWIVVTVVDADQNQSTVLNWGENIAFDMLDNYTCRYLQQNLSDRQDTKRRTDFCDYDTGLHYGIQDDSDQNTPCSMRKALGMQS